MRTESTIYSKNMQYLYTSWLVGNSNRTVGREINIMGNRMSFSGYGGTPESACKFLEEDIHKVFPKAFVTVSDDSLKVITLSPRTVTRMALVSFGNGEHREVLFKKDKFGITCSVVY